MIPPDLLRQIRRLQLRARRAVQSLLGGEYRSVFKGSGLSFDEVREYQPGDDVRSIDWNVTARMGHPFIKRYVEERELTVLLLIDVSASLRFGSHRQKKRAVAAELAALVAFSAIANNDRVGMIACSDRVEEYVPPARGQRHVLRLLRDILFHEPEHRGTSLRAGLQYLLQVQRKRAIVFVISDFHDADFESDLRLAGSKHDVVAIRVADALESRLPAAGLVQFQDAEGGQRLLIDTGDRRVRNEFERRGRARAEALRKTMRSARVDLIEVETDGNHFEALLQFFRVREKRWRHA